MLRNKKVAKLVVSLVIVVALASTAFAVPFTPNFSDAPAALLTGTQTDLTGDLNVWYNTNYGISFDHMYLYIDSRDTFDQMGISNGWAAENNMSDITGVLNFTDTTDYVTIDWWQVYTYPMNISVYDTSNALVGSFDAPNITEANGTLTFTAANISRLTLSGTGGYSAISGLSYNYDGTTDGTNNDTGNRVPEPGTMLLLGAGLAGLATLKKKMK